MARRRLPPAEGEGQYNLDDTFFRFSVNQKTFLLAALQKYHMGGLKITSSCNSDNLAIHNDLCRVIQVFSLYSRRRKDEDNESLLCVSVHSRVKLALSTGLSRSRFFILSPRPLLSSSSNCV